MALCPEIINSDLGAQSTSEEWEKFYHLKAVLACFIYWYNEERLHSSLKDKMPRKVLKK
ncbi:MAG: integrase core domain-containing protein [Alphaproteobacteria bacterium]|nr:integrase core domain-containing protein [Alphaproteobacteria bacterium]MBP9777154.1 integrase core domain-containing protein [Alphaproteobacteria bacterium]